MPGINLGLIESLVPMVDAIWQAFRRYQSFWVTSHVMFVAKQLNFFLHRLLFAAAAGLPVMPGLRASPGSVGGLFLVPAHPLLLLLPCLHSLLFSHGGGSPGGVQLPRPLPLGAVRVLLRAHRMSRILSWLLWDLPSQLEGRWRTRPED